MKEKKRKICITAQLSTGEEWDRWLQAKRLMAREVGTSYLTNRQLMSILAANFIEGKNEDSL